MKLWAGRFQKETDTLVNDFNSSIGFDARLYEQDIRGSMAHAAMLGKTGVIEAHEAEKIVEGLQAILADIEADKVEFSLDNEDIHMNIEAELTRRVGEAGKRLHTARSRNDQVAVDTRLYVKEEIPVIIGQVLDLEKVLVKKAKANLDTVMPGLVIYDFGDSIRFGLAAVKGVGRGFVKEVFAQRQKNGPFTSFPDFCRRMSHADLNKRVLENLIRCGAFDSMGVFRSQLLDAYEQVVDSIARAQRQNLEGQFDLFGGGGDRADMPSTELTIDSFGDGEIGIMNLLVACGLAPSKGEARRLVQQGGVTVNDEKVTDVYKSFTTAELDGDGALIIRKGKKVYHKIVQES